MDKRGQVTVFVIIALVILGAVILYFVFKGSLVQTPIPATLEPAYTSFLSCLQQNTLTGVDVLESQGGYINPPTYEPGSQYSPFGSQLDFLGNPIPYWYYLSGNNVQKTQVPSKGDMEKQLSDFIDSRIRDCNLQTYYDQGFVISETEPSTSVTINSDSVDVKMSMDLTIQKGNDTATIRSHEKIIPSNIGSLYDSAMVVYNYEQQSMFLENYSVDTLRAYAPVDGIEISCSPKVWSASQVFTNLSKGIEVNTLALRTSGSNYVLTNPKNKYFVVDIPGVSSSVRFLTSQTWPNSFEVNPSQGSALIATPVGNQPGLGILGFCYIPYHFVYNVKYPVLIQIDKGGEIFQFPMAVILNGNLPRNSSSGAVDSELPQSDLCQYKNTPIQVRVYDNNMAPVNADISYKCFGDVCAMGAAVSGGLNANFPQCVNGYIVAKAPGYKDSETLYSTTESGSVDVFIDKIYNLNLNLLVDGKAYNGAAIVSFNSNDTSSRTVIYPDQKTIGLSPGQYEVQVYIYKNSSIQIQQSTTTACVDIPDSGIGGAFGLTKQKCVDLVVPAQIISNVLAGGGKQTYYLIDNELNGANTIEVNVPSIPVPASIEQLQNNYAQFDANHVDLSFK